MSADFDKAIDGAVREMLDVEPRADLRERVMAQLPASGFRLPASRLRLPASGWVLGSLAAAALIVLALFVARHEPVAPQPPTVAHGGDQYLPPLSPAGREVRVQPPPRTTTPPRAARVAARNPVTAAAANDDKGVSTRIEPLKSITPIGAAPIEAEHIAPTDIAVRPLTAITEIQIAPLTPPDRRN